MTESQHLSKSFGFERHVTAHRRFWVVQRAWWGLLFLLILAAVLGLFGEGLFSGRSNTSGGLSVDYQWVVRNDSITRLEITLQSPEPEMEVAISGAYVQGVLIEQITPNPDSETLTDGEVIYTFETEEGSEAATFDILLRPQGFGVVRAEIEAGGERVSIRQVVLP